MYSYTQSSTNIHKLTTLGHKPLRNTYTKFMIFINALASDADIKMVAESVLSGELFFVGPRSQLSCLKLYFFSDKKHTPGYIITGYWRRLLLLVAPNLPFSRKARALKEVVRSRDFRAFYASSGRQRAKRE